MTRFLSENLEWLITDADIAKAKIQFELKQKEFRLQKIIEGPLEIHHYYAEILVFVHQILIHYSDYFLLLGHDPERFLMGTLVEEPDIHIQSYFDAILKLKSVGTDARSPEDEVRWVSERIRNYSKLKNHIASLVHEPARGSEHLEPQDPFNLLVDHEHLGPWLFELLESWDDLNPMLHSVKINFNTWSREDIIQALEFVNSDQYVDLANSLFFYKLFPDKLFNELIHPEKLVSVRLRLGLLHTLIETIATQLFSAAQYCDIEPGIDYFFHGDDLPQGILIDVCDEVSALIRSAIKNLNVRITKEDEHQVTLERLNDLRLSYKFWFNPNRLIDASMVLYQRLVGESDSEDDQLTLFFQEMKQLYSDLTTSECMDLYGYFANDDSRYLMYTLNLITNGRFFEWLPPPNRAELSAIRRVFDTLKCVMEALRIELQSRHVMTQPYQADLAADYRQAGRRIRDAVYRIIVIYGSEKMVMSESLEKLFRSIEQR